MADQEFIYKLTIDTTGVEVGKAAASLASLKKQILETESEIAKLKAGIKDGSKSFADAAGPLSQYEAKLKGLRTAFNETSREALGIQGFTAKIGDQFAKALGPIEGLLGKLGPLGGAIQSISSQLGNIGKTSAVSADGVGKLNSFTSGLGKAAGGALLGVGALVGGLAALGVGIQSSIQSYDNSIKAQRSLEQALGRTSQALLDQAGTLQDITGFQDDAITRGQAYAATLGLTEDQILKLTPAVLDLAAATGTDVNDAFAKVAQSIEGSKNSLGKYGVEISKTGSQSEKVGQVIDGLNEKFQGQAEAIGNAGAGSITKFQNTLDDLQETLGRLIIQGIGPLVEGLTSAVHAVDDFISGNDALEASIAQGTKQLQDQQQEFGTLIAKLTDVNLKEEERAKVIETLNTKFPDLIGNINLEKASTAQLNDVLARGNNLFIAKLGLLAQEEELKEAAKKQGEAKAEEIKAENALIKAIRAKIQASSDAGDAAELQLLNERKNVQELADKYGLLSKVDIRATQGIAGTKSAGIKFNTNEVDDAALAFDNARKATEEAKAATDELARSVNEIAEGFGVESEVANQALGTTGKAARDTTEAFVALGKGIASIDQVGLVISSIHKDLQQGSLDADGLAAALVNVNKAIAQTPKIEGNAGSIAQLNIEKKAIEEEIAALNSKATDKTTKNNKAVAETYEDRVKKISSALDLELAKIDAQEDKKLISGIEADARRNEALSKSLDQRIKLEEEAALKAAKNNGGEIPLQFKVKIAGLEEEKAKVDAEAQQIRKDIEDKVAAIQGRVTIKVKADLFEFDAVVAKAVGDASALQDLRVDLSKAFEGTGEALSQELKTALEGATLSGNKIDFDKLVANADVPKKKIEELEQAYTRFQLQTERTKLELVKRDDQEKLRALREELENLILKREQLLAKKEASKTDISIVYTDADQADLDKTEESLNRIKGEVVTAEVQVKVDDKALDGLGDKIKAVTPDAGGGKKNPSDSLFGGLFGISDDQAQFFVDKATEVANAISEAVIDAKREQIARSLALTMQSIDDERNSTIQGIEDQVDAGLITEQQAELRRRLADKQAADARLAAQKKAFEQEKKLKRAEATINYFSELAGIAATATQTGPAAPVYYGIQAGIATIRYVANLAAINSAQVAEKGAKIKAQRGVLAKGPSHADGGIAGLINGQQVVELEGGEIIINRKSSERFAPLLSAINEAEGNGVKLTSSPVTLDQIEAVAPEGVKMFGPVAKAALGASSIPVKKQKNPGIRIDQQDEGIIRSKEGSTVEKPKKASFGARVLAAFGLSIPVKKQKNPGVSFEQDELLRGRVGVAANGGLIARGTSYANSVATDADPIPNIRRFSLGGFSPSFSFGSMPRFSVGGNIPRAFANGGQISVIPNDETIANRRQLIERIGSVETQRVIELNGERDQRQSVVYLSELSAKTTRIQRTQDRVSFGG